MSWNKVCNCSFKKIIWLTSSLSLPHKFRNALSWRRTLAAILSADSLPSKAQISAGDAPACFWWLYTLWTPISKCFVWRQTLVNSWSKSWLGVPGVHIMSHLRWIILITLITNALSIHNRYFLWYLIATCAATMAACNSALVTVWWIPPSNPEATAENVLLMLGWNIATPQAP